MTAPVCDHPVRLLATSGHSRCCFAAQRISSRLKKHDEARDEFKLLSLLDTEITDDERVHLIHSITVVYACSSLKSRSRQMLKGCARFLIAPSTPVWSLTGSTSIGCSALNFLEGDVCRIVAQPTGSPIDQCEITQRDHLNIFRLAAPHADMSFTTVSHFRVGILGNSLSFVITCLTCPPSLEYRHCQVIDEHV